jgi:hypothetical protein
MGSPDVWEHTMKKLHPIASCFALLLIFACSDHGEPGTDGARDETSVESRPAQRSPAEGTPTGTSVQEKLTCPSGCVKISSTPPVPLCCNCNGQEHIWKKSTWSATTWLCQ